MENKEYLNEESYQKAKKKITKISLIILIVGIVLGGSLIAVGAIKQSNAKKDNEKIYNETNKKSKASKAQKEKEAKEKKEKAQKEYDEKVATTNERLKAIETEKEELNKKIEEKEYECDSLDMGADNWFADNTRCEKEVNNLESKVRSLETEELTLKSSLKSEQIKLENILKKDDITFDFDDTFDKFDTIYNDMSSSIKYSIFYILGAWIIGISCMISLAFYLIAKRREIRAFTIQQTMPVTQEAIDKMAPTIGNAAGNIAGGIAKGIKEGLNDDDE